MDYCKLFVKTSMEYEELYILVSQYLNAERIYLRSLKTNWGTVDVLKNKEYIASTDSVNDFLYWKFIIDIDKAPRKREEEII